MPKLFDTLGAAFAAAAVTLACLCSPVARAQSTPAVESPANAGPVRLRQPVQPMQPASSDTAPSAGGASGQAVGGAAGQGTAIVGAAPGEFEVYVRGLSGNKALTRLGADLLRGLQGRSDGADHNPLVPPDYLVRVGDELVITLWGSVDADLRLQVDRSGRISIPRVGPVMVAGVRYADLPDVISRRVGLVFKNFQLSVVLGQLRGVRVYVTGFASRPGALNVSGLSTLAQALLSAGGPAAAGSYRNIQLRRGGTAIATFDLYDLLLKGERGADQIVQPDDVVHVGPVGPQVAVFGSVNRPAIFELKPGEMLDDVLRMAGGFSPVADVTRLALERFNDRATGRVVQLAMPESARLTLANGDVLRAFNAAEVAQPSERQNKRVRIEGEVARPGEYILGPASTLADALQAAGGKTANAYLYAASFTRESVRETQQINYDRALRDLETQINSNAASRRATTSEEVSLLAASTAASNRFLDQLRSLKPSGRVVIQTTPDSDSLPELALEDGDRLFIPSKPTTVGVFGSVFSAGSYLHSANRTVGDYLRLAGGPTRGADDGAVFVIRANGSVSSSLQESGFLSRGNQIAKLRTEPGDTIFVPEEMNKSTWVQNAKDWTQILYQFGIGLAGIKSAVQ